MKRKPFTAFVLLLISLAVHLSCTQKKIGPSKDISIGDLRNVHFPDTPTTTITSSLNHFLYQNPESSLELTYFDTIVARTKNADDFATALRGYVSGRFSGRTFALYDLSVTDTIIGKVNGFFISGYTIDTLQLYQQLFCFITIANSKSYWFFTFQQKASPINAVSKQFFGSIQFNTDDFSESHFRTSHLKLHKPIGKIWHLTPDFELIVPPTYDSDENNNTAPPK